MTTSQLISGKSRLQREILILTAFVVNSENLVIHNQDHISWLIISCVHVTRLLANDKVKRC